MMALELDYQLDLSVHVESVHELDYQLGSLLDTELVYDLDWTKGHKTVLRLDTRKATCLGLRKNRTKTWTPPHSSFEFVPSPSPTILRTDPPIRRNIVPKTNSTVRDNLSPPSRDLSPPFVPKSTYP